MVQRTVLQKVESGQIETTWNGVFLAIEFNCNCLDALPVCKGLCCKYRSGYSVELLAEELPKYKHRQHPTDPSVYILAAAEDGLTCYYQDQTTNLCTIHRDRPKMCKQWACSPGTLHEDPEVERRDAGWLLTPIRREESELIQIQMEKQKR